MPTIFIENLTKEEKKMLDVAKAMSGAKNWKEFVLGLVKENRDLLIEMFSEEKDSK